MTAFYAFARHTDDLGDQAASPEEKERRLLSWRETLSAALVGSQEHPWLPAVVDSVHRYSIPTKLLFELIDGVAMDIRPTPFETFDELRRYCYHVAGTVGLACLHIWEFNDQAAYAPAEAVGLAFQLTNILRDLGEDSGVGRLYLPKEDLVRFEYRESDLHSKIVDERFDKLIKFQADRAEQFYREGAATAQYLSRDGRRMFRMMFNTYYTLLNEIRRQPRSVLYHRLRLSVPRKLAIAALSFVPGFFPPSFSTTPSASSL